MKIVFELIHNRFEYSFTKSRNISHLAVPTNCKCSQDLKQIKKQVLLVRSRTKISKDKESLKVTIIQVSESYIGRIFPNLFACAMKKYTKTTCVHVHVLKCGSFL